MRTTIKDGAHFEKKDDDLLDATLSYLSMSFPNLEQHGRKVGHRARSALSESA